MFAASPNIKLIFLIGVSSDSISPYRSLCTPLTVRIALKPQAMKWRNIRCCPKRQLRSQTPTKCTLEKEMFFLDLVFDQNICNFTISSRAKYLFYGFDRHIRVRRDEGKLCFFIHTSGISKVKWIGAVCKCS